MELKKCYEKYVAEFGNEKWSHIDYSDSEACQDFYNRIQDFIEFSFYTSYSINSFRGVYKRGRILVQY